MATLTVSCKIDQRVIDKYTKEQRTLGERVTLSDKTCSGLKLVINNRSASWTYAYRKRGYMDGGKRHPQRTMKLGDPVTMPPAEARFLAEQVKAQVRVGADPAVEQRKAASERKAQEARKMTCAAWLDRYNAEQMGDGSTKYQRDEVRNVKLALQELNLLVCYALRSVLIGKDEDGDDVTSAVVEPTEPVKKATRLSGQQKIAMHAFEDAIAHHGEKKHGDMFPNNRQCVSLEHWKNYCRRHSLSGGEGESSQRTAFHKVKTYLQEKEVIRVVDGFVWRCEG